MLLLFLTNNFVKNRKYFLWIPKSQHASAPWPFIPAITNFFSRKQKTKKWVKMHLHIWSYLELQITHTYTHTHTSTHIQTTLSLFLSLTHTNTHVILSRRLTHKHTASHWFCQLCLMQIVSHQVGAGPPTRFLSS